MKTKEWVCVEDCASNDAREPCTMAPGLLPLNGVRAVAMVGLGPITHATLVLANLGADIVRIERPVDERHRTDIDPLNAVVAASVPSVAVDLRSEEGKLDVLSRIERADVLIEGMRPGVMERLGLGPDDCRKLNPRLVYGRVTGWGQHGPLSLVAAHDINYLSVGGTLHDLRRPGERPFVPFNYLADYAGGSMFLITGVLAALLQARESGEGVVIDAAMVDGLASIMAFQFAMRAQGDWDQPGVNQVASPPPYYDVYETADGKFVACGAAEPQFYREMISGLGMEPESMPQDATERWPQYAEAIRTAFRNRTRDEWAAAFAHTDACVTPVLSPFEAAAHPHIAARGAILDIEGKLSAGGAPRFQPLRGVDPDGRPPGRGRNAT